MIDLHLSCGPLPATYFFIAISYLSLSVWFGLGKQNRIHSVSLQITLAKLGKTVLVLYFMCIVKPLVSLTPAHKMPSMLPSRCNDQRLPHAFPCLQGATKTLCWLLIVASKSSGSRLPWSTCPLRVLLIWPQASCVITAGFKCLHL